MTADYTMLNHEMTTFKIQNQISFNASPKYYCETMQALIKRITVNTKIIHKNFHNFGDKVKKQMVILHLWNVDGALHKPNDIHLKA